MKSKPSYEIWYEFQKLTQATPVPISDDESRQMAEFMHKRNVAEDDRSRSQALNNQRKREKALKEMARAGAPAVSPANAQAGKRVRAAAAA